MKQPSRGTICAREDRREDNTDRTSQMSALKGTTKARASVQGKHGLQHSYSPSYVCADVREAQEHQRTRMQMRGMATAHTAVLVCTQYSHLLAARNCHNSDFSSLVF